MKVEKISRRLFLKSSSIMALSALSFNSGMTVFADDSGDRENFRTKNTINTILILEKNQLKKLYLKLIP